MNWNDQDIDHLFRGAKAPEPPPFEEAFWTEMEAMLPPQKKRRTAAIWWFSGGAATLLLAGTIGFFAVEDSTGDVRVSATEKHKADTHEYRGGTPTGEEDRADVSDVGHESGGGAEEPAPAAGPRSPQTVAAARTDVPSKEEAGGELAGPVAVTAVVQPLNPLPFSENPDEVERRFDAKSPRPARFYVQVSVGAGQSARRNVSGSSGFLHCYTVGGGLFTRVDNMVLTFGLNGRVDFTDNIVRSVGTAPGSRIETRYRQLYSIETPASLGYTFGRNTIAANVTPGFQTGFSGQEHELVDETLVRSGHTSGKVENARTLTMEFGLSYWRTLQPEWEIGAVVGFDALRPFNNTLFLGEQRTAPLNGQIVLRRTF